MIRMKVDSYIYILWKMKKLSSFSIGTKFHFLQYSPLTAISIIFYYECLVFRDFRLKISQQLYYLLEAPPNNANKIDPDFKQNNFENNFSRKY